MKDQKIYLHHILDAINEIETFTEDGDWKNQKTERAVERCIEIIGEAANKLTKSFQKKFPEIEWDLIVGMRNKIIHDYFDVDANLVRVTVEEDLPTLKKQIRKILTELQNQ